AGFLVGHGFFWLFVGDAATSALYGLVAFFALPRGVRRRSGDHASGPALAVLLRDHKLHQVLIAASMIALIFFHISSTFPFRLFIWDCQQQITGSFSR